MGRLILGDYVKNKRLLILILLLLLLSYFELNDDYRFGGYLRDIIYKPIVIENNRLIDSLNEEIEKENIELKELMNVKSLSEFDVVYATITERNIDYWLNELTINKGYIDGINKNMIVVTNEGVIGKIKEVNNNTSIVKLITSDDLNNITQVSINNTNYIMSFNNGKLIIKGVEENSKISLGDKVLTSGLLDKIPKGLLIGIVDKINNENVGLSLEVKLSADTSDLRFVAVLKRKDS